VLCKTHTDSCTNRPKGQRRSNHVSCWAAFALYHRTHYPGGRGLGRGVSPVSSAAQTGPAPTDNRALVAVDLGAESCRVALLRWVDGTPHIQMVHRFPNGPVHSADGSLRWPLEAITIGVDHGLRLCAEL